MAQVAHQQEYSNITKLSSILITTATKRVKMNTSIQSGDCSAAINGLTLNPKHIYGIAFIVSLFCE